MSLFSDVDVVDIRKEYCKKKHTTRAVKKMNLVLEEGDICAIVGENGSGKSTLLKLMAGIIEPDRGKILYTALDLQEHCEVKEKIVYLPESFLTDDDLTGHEFLKAFLLLHRVKYSQEKGIEIAKKIHLKHDFLSYQINEYSKGMRQKLFLIYTVLTDAKIMLLDEPFSGVDDKGKEGIMDIIKDFKKQKKVILFSTHDFEEIENICNKIIIVKDGKDFFSDEITKFHDEYCIYRNFKKDVYNFIYNLQ